MCVVHVVTAQLCDQIRYRIGVAKDRDIARVDGKARGQNFCGTCQARLEILRSLAARLGGTYEWDVRVGRTSGTYEWDVRVGRTSGTGVGLEWDWSGTYEWDERVGRTSGTGVGPARTHFRSPSRLMEILRQGGGVGDFGSQFPTHFFRV